MPSSFTIRTIPLSAISVDKYQRDRLDATVEKIVANFDLAQWDLPKVTETSDDEFRVIAGQHRVEAARLLEVRKLWPFSTPVGHIEAQVVSGIEGTKGEAILFMRDAKNKKPLAPFDTHRASLIAEDPKAIEVQNALDRLGIKLVKKQGVKNGETLSAITAVYKLWERGHGHGGTLVYDTLRIASSWSADDPYRFDGLVLGGLGMVIRDITVTGGKLSKLERVIGAGKRQLAARTLEGLAHRWSVQNGGVFSNTPFPYATVIRQKLEASRISGDLAPEPAPARPFISRLPNAPAYATGQTAS